MINYIHVVCDCGKCTLCAPPEWTLTTTNTDDCWYVINNSNNLEILKEGVDDSR